MRICMKSVLTIFIISILSNNVLASSDDLVEKLKILFAKPTQQQEITNSEMEVWRDSFLKELINQKDPDLKTMGLFDLANLMQNLPKDAENSSEFEFIASEILETAQTDNISGQSLMLLHLVCSSKSLQSSCDIEDIEAIQQHHSPENILVYLQSLERAVLEEGTGSITEIMNQMAKSTYVDNYQYLSQKFMSHVDSYVKANPFPISHLESEYELLKKFNTFSDSKLNRVKQDGQGYAKFMLLSNYKLRLPIFPYRNLTEVCSSKSLLKIQCLKIAKLLISQDKDYLAKNIGLRMDKILADLYGGEKDVKQKTENIDTYKRQAECVIDASRQHSKQVDNNFNLKHFKNYIKEEREFGEIGFIYNEAARIYDELSAKGFTDIKHPDQCYK